MKPLASPLDSALRHGNMDSLFGDVPDLDSRKAAEKEQGPGKSGKVLGRRSVANLFMRKHSRKMVGGPILYASR